MISYSEIVEALVHRLPWIRNEPEYAAFYQAWVGDIPGPHVVYGDVVVPIVVRLLRSESLDERRLIDIFSFLEEIVNSTDERVSEVGVVSVLEDIHESRDVWDLAHRYMGPVSSHYAELIEDAWGA